MPVTPSAHRASVVARASLVLALAIGAVACSDSDSDGDDGDTIATNVDDTAATSDPGSTDATGDVDDTGDTDDVPAPPEGARWIEVPGIDVRFAAPDDWIDVEPDSITADDGGFDAVAEELGIDPAELESIVDESVALYVFSPERSEGFTDNVTVIEVPLDAVPPLASIESEIGSLGAEVLETDVVERGDITIARVPYRLAVQSIEVEGVALFARVDDVTVNITVSATDRARADEVARLIVDTIVPAR